MHIKTHYQVKARLTAAEHAMLLRICTATGGGNSYNPSEMVRLLIHREYAKRTRKRDGKSWSVVPDRMIASDWRRGRPKVAGNQEIKDG